MAEKIVGIKFPLQDSTLGFFLEGNRTSQESMRSKIIYLIFTLKKQRYYKPRFGSDLYRFIFEPNDEVTLKDVVSNLNESIADFLPEVEIIDLQTTKIDDDKGINIKLSYVVNQGVLQLRDTIEVII